ncbi:hypothetical protein [Thermoleptolyngbya sp. C42_A2020_037]|uniref:hypothetical protein n=1 Tax=Thermoleptolyngbya sp. C42_A2020_037 TaxID=2747799 RepID=UPI0019F04838|nr:hypothetical protein [Thermoleptolyngbya sp. C42_A2020_037]MBF2087253.1 hypothetical protein [Thermoleptolyngbya sp. C42_A2020_037]
MLMAVVVLNFSLALFGLYAAWWVWQLGQGLRQVADTLTHAERQTSRTLQGAPVAIAQGQTNIEQLRRQLRQVGPQVQRLRQAIALVSLAQSLWFGGRGFGFRRRAKAKATPKQARQLQAYRGHSKSRD